MALADIEHDVNVFLPEDRIELLDSDAPDLQRDAERMIRGMLMNVIEPAVMATWVDPGNTPELIRGIAGRLIASLYYMRRFSSNDSDVPGYAQELYNQAMEILNGIVNGTIILILPDDTVVAASDAFTTDDFWPNASTDPPKFKMGDRY